MNMTLTKEVGSHLGGTRNPMVVHWPARITEGGALRSQFTHAIDVGPTILDILKIPAPSQVDGVEQEPFHGVTFADSLADAAAPEHRSQQYFETMGNRAMYKDGWWLAIKTPRIPWVITPDALRPYAPGVWDPDGDPAELYYLPDDFTQANDLAADHPGKVAELKELFWAEAEKYKVLPLLATLSAFFGILPPRPDEVPVEYRDDVQNIMSRMIPRIYNHSYAISADLVVPAGGAEGIARKWTCTHWAGRPPVGTEIAALIERLATENHSGDTSGSRASYSSPGHRVSASTICRVLKTLRIPPAPKRRTDTTWRQFLHAQAATMVATGFFHVDFAVTLRRLYCLSVIEAGSRRRAPAGRGSAANRQGRT